MAVTVRLLEVLEHPDGTFECVFDDKTTLTYHNRADYEAATDEAQVERDLRDRLRLVAVASRRKRGRGQVDGRPLTLDLGNPAPLRFG